MQTKIPQIIRSLRKMPFNGFLMASQKESMAKTRCMSLWSSSQTSSQTRNTFLRPSIGLNLTRGAANLPQSDKELFEFLESEIGLEKKAQKKSPSLQGWKINADGSNFTLTKTFNDEEITIRANINHSVDSDSQDDFDPNKQEETAAEMVSRPDFNIEIKRGNEILGINCSFGEFDGMEDPNLPQEISDEFQINELSIFEGEFKENTYAVSGEVMDGNMYDLLINLLQERGIDQNFARSFIDFATAYEHNQYVGLLEKLKNFISRK